VYKKLLVATLVAFAQAGATPAQDPTMPPYGTSLNGRSVPSGMTGPAGRNSPLLTQYQMPPGPNGAVGPTDSAAAIFGGPDANSSDFALRGWFSGDYLMLFPNPMRSPSLLQDGGGATLIGGPTALGISHGVRIDSGVWLKDDRIAMQGISFFTFDNYTTAFQPAGTVPMAGPIPPTDVTNFNYVTFTRLGGGEGNMLYRFGDAGGDSRLYGIVGTKFLLLEEDLRLDYSLGDQEVGGDFTDQFHTRNQFLGGQVGLMFARRFDRLTVDVTGKVAVGENIAQLMVMGSNSAGINFQLFSGRSNIGFFETTYFSVLPEVNINFSYALTDRLSARLGYSFLCMINTWRPGDQISLANDGGVTVPAAPLLNSTFFLHGLNAGVTFRY
jgi:hypothetical protein